MFHTTAHGTESFDRSYGLGYDRNHKDLSPIRRTNILRRRFLDREFWIDSERAVLVTETYRENEDKPQVIRCALALKNVLEHVRIDIEEDQLLAGDVAAPFKAAPVYPEFSTEWIMDELLHHPFGERPHDRFYITDEDREKLLEILPYWKGKTVADEAELHLDEEQRKGCEMGKRVYMTNLYHFGGIGHYDMDYGKLMRLGFGGLAQEAKDSLARLENEGSDCVAPVGTPEQADATDPADSKNKASVQERKEFLEAVIISLEAASEYVLRYARLAQNMAEQAEGARREELLKMAENMRVISRGPAQTFWQALQLWHFATTLVQIESNGHSVSYGRMDQWLYPYYRSSLESGEADQAFMQELLECAYVKMNNPSKLKDRMTVQVRNGRGWGGESLTIGGVDTQGNDATNDLTFMMLEASAHTRMMNPWVCVRVHEKTPYELKVKAVECIRAGYGHPKLYNDATTIRVMKAKGMSEEEARDYAVVGCVEPDLPGREYGFHDAAYVNMAKVLDLAINHGRCIDCSPACPRYEVCAKQGKQLGPDTGGLDTFRNMDEVLESFREQISYWVDRICNGVNCIDLAHRKVKPTPFASAFFESCLERGLDLSRGGAKYNFSGPQACGIATCADSFSAISQLIFDQGTCTGEEMLDALRNNWEGHEYLYALVNSRNVHHFGNDDDYADRFYRFVFETYCAAVGGHDNVRGGFFTPGVYSVNANVGMGLNTPATPDGRKAFEPISDNMGPVHTAAGSHDVSGPTAIANSVNKVDHALATNGTLLNWKFPPECVAGESGRRNLISFIDTYFEGGATHCQFNIMSSETMRRAMAVPDEYRDMLVRVAGYSAYFVELSEPLQLDLINRTELSF